MAENSATGARGPQDSRSTEAFARDFEAAGPALLTWARLRVRPELRAMLDPEDLIQEVGCRAFASLHTFDRERGSFRQWLFGFANHVLLEALRELGRQPRRIDAGPDRSGLSDAVAVITTITRKVAKDEIVRLFLTRMDDLEAADRELLLHHGLEELPHAQVAVLLGAGEDAVRKRWQRLVERLRQDPAFGSLAIGA